MESADEPIILSVYTDCCIVFGMLLHSKKLLTRMLSNSCNVYRKWERGQPWPVVLHSAALRWVKSFFCNVLRIVLTFHKCLTLFQLKTRAKFIKTVKASYHENNSFTYTFDKRYGAYRKVFDFLKVRFIAIFLIFIFYVLHFLSSINLLVLIILTSFHSSSTSLLISKQFHPTTALILRSYIPDFS